MTTVATGQVPLTGLTTLHPLEHQLASLQPRTGLSGQSPGRRTRRSAVAQDYLRDGDFSTAIALKSCRLEPENPSSLAFQHPQIRSLVTPPVSYTHLTLP